MPTKTSNRNKYSMELELIKEQGIQSAKIDNIEKDIQVIQLKLDKVVQFVNETKGGHKFLWGILTLASTLGAIIGALVTYFSNSGGKSLIYD